MTKAGNIYTGVCIDTASTLGMCGERNANANMITNGESQIAKVVAICDGKVGSPCGAMLSRMFQVMENFHSNGCWVAEDTGLDNTVATRRMKVYSFTTRNGRNVPQIILSRN